MTAPAELREMMDDELFNRLADAKQELFNLRFQLVTGQLDNYARLPQVKREVARINTILREREIAAAEAIEAAEVSRAAEVSTAEETSGA
jgi:large subunit ribosomal protein L29